MKKDVNISVIRLIALLMIISCHILQGLNNLWASWLNLGVQIFFFVSGYLYGVKRIDDYCDFFIKRLKKILLPTSIVIIISVISLICFNDMNYSIKSIFVNIIGLGGFNNSLSIISHTWFVSYILFCYLILPIIQKLFDDSKKPFNVLIIIILFSAVFDFCGVMNVNFLWISNFILGYYYSRFCLKNEKIKRNYFIVFATLTIFLLPLNLATEYSIFNVPSVFIKMKTIIWNLEHVLLGTTIFIFLNNILALFNLKYNKFLELSDKYNFYIYLVHQIFILNEFSLLKITNRLAINICLIIIVSIIFGILLYYLTVLVSIIIGKIYKFIKKYV